MLCFDENCSNVFNIFLRRLYSVVFLSLFLFILLVPRNVKSLIIRYKHKKFFS